MQPNPVLNKSSRIWFSLEAGQKERIDQLISKNKVVIFMKGAPNEPRCGFSRAVVQVNLD